MFGERTACLRDGEGYLRGEVEGYHLEENCD